MRKTLVCIAINRNMSEIDWYNDDWLFTEYEVYSNRKIIRTVTCKNLLYI